MGKHKHEIIYHDLLMKIQNQTYAINDIIPTEIELAQEYQVSRPTVRQALARLVQEGYLQRKKHLGTRVISNKIRQQFTNKIQSFETEMLSAGVLPMTKVLSYGKHEMNQLLRNVFQREDEQCWELVRLRYAKKDPILLVTTYLPLGLDEGMKDVDFEKTSLYEYLTSINQRVVHINRKIEVEAADAEVAGLLAIAKGDPIFVFRSIGYNDQNEVVEYSISKYRGDMSSFEIDLYVDDYNFI